MKRLLHIIVVLCLISSSSFAQRKILKLGSKNNTPGQLNRPKLVVGLVVDQMRWDYLYRYYDRYSNGGFKRLVNEGFSAENTMIPYTPTYTACGHSCIYTGSVPAVNGIIGNNWYDPELQKDVYCTEDSGAHTVGSGSNAGEMSPKNLLTTTITDELRLATNFKSKVIGISLKDRGSILPAGHSANAAYWYDGVSGNWITSTYYMKQLPPWLDAFNKQKLQNKFYAGNWNTLYPINTYTQSTADNNAFEGLYKGETTTTFPHKLSDAIDKNFDLIRSTPFGNTITLDLAKRAIAAESLGKGTVTDFLAVSCSSPDYIGHQFGPNSIEVEDTYLRLDKDIESFLTYLDQTLGKGNYLIFLTADHGAAHTPKFLAENKLPGGIVSNKDIAANLNKAIEQEFKIKESVLMVMNNQIIYNKPLIAKADADLDDLRAFTVDFLKHQTGIQDAVDITRLSSATLPEVIKTRITNGYNARRSGDVYFLLKSNWFDGGATGTTHGAWYPYDSHIPLVFMGWNVKPGKTNKTHYMTDISATLAAMLRIQMPSGCVGEPISEISNQ
ncbi:MAG: type phosphodiesterase/nucleotide pyrophosphatase [Pedobacter sp.]|jgi:predicted AlkP superfamily pyrophosphatase or phosphodiesterase|nr:type phosphodiesterase/nucleotide pyrophosphatase [Pedobacter sp.]